MAKGHHNDVWVFQRGTVVWDLKTFGSKNNGQNIADPTAFVTAPAVVQLNQVRRPPVLPLSLPLCYLSLPLHELLCCLSVLVPVAAAACNLFLIKKPCLKLPDSYIHEAMPHTS